MAEFDVLVVGGGVVGLATALNVTERHPGARVVVVDKEDRPARHQSGHNSGVLHSGLYYPPGSLKARLAVTGRAEMVEFCARNAVAHDVCGKVVVAVNEAELPMLDRLHHRGLANGVPNTRVGAARLAELEPHATGIAALHVPSTGIVDYVAVCDRMADLLRTAGGEVRLSTEVTALRERVGEVVVESADGELLTAAWVVNCGGLQADRVAKSAGTDPGLQIIPFRGEYYELIPSRSHLVRNLVYPVPDPAFPFLGVHFTRAIDGCVEAGPNAVLALAREGYRWRDIDLGDLAETLRYRGFRALARRHWRAGLGEMWRSASKRAFVHALQRLVPSLGPADLVRTSAGVRAQALRPDGDLVDDFAILEQGRIVHVLNAPSPAATAALPIGRKIAATLAERLPG